MENKEEDNKQLEEFSERAFRERLHTRKREAVRTRFAAVALNGILSNAPRNPRDNSPDIAYHVAAAEAYAYASIMLETCDKVNPINLEGAI